MAFQGLQVSKLLKNSTRKVCQLSLAQRCLHTSINSSGLFLETSPKKGVFANDNSLKTLRFYHTSKVQLAGHSKWSNIKHIKAAQDAKKGAMGGVLSRRVQQCLIRNPETDPKLNTQLAAIMKEAKANNIPNETIQKAIDRAIQLKDPSKISAFDGRGPANTGIVIECISLKPHHTKTQLQGIVKKFGFSLLNSGADLFEHKGMIEVDLPEDDLPKALEDPENFDLDKFVDIAIESGAEDVTLEPGEDNPILVFKCGPQDLLKVQKALDEAGMSVITGERVFIPTLTVPVSSEFMEAYGKLTEKLDKFPDIVRYYNNLELEQR